MCRCCMLPLSDDSVPVFEFLFGLSCCWPLLKDSEPQIGWSFGMPATAHLTAALACSHFARYWQSKTEDIAGVNSEFAVFIREQPTANCRDTKR